MTSHLKPPTVLEEISGHSATEGVLTLIGALSGSPLAALLPVLSKSLASARQRQRVEEALQDMDETLRQHADALRNLSDPRYKLINETVLALLHTTSPEKILYLRRAVRNILEEPDVLPQEADVLSRVIRDISADEAAFLLANFHFHRVQFWPLQEQDDPRQVLAISPESREGVVVAGLVSLGLLLGTSPIMCDLGRYAFAPIVAKILALLREPHSSL